MANASKHHMGLNPQGKHDGSGAMTDMDDLPDDILGENMVLSNHDKAQHGDQRGLDSKSVQADQYQDTAANRLEEGEEGAIGGENTNSSGLSAPSSGGSRQDSSRS